PPPPPRRFVINSPWATVTPERNVLVVLRTATTVSWFAELLPDVIADPRIQLTFTIDPGSQFQPGVAAYLQSLGAAPITWESATTTPFGLAIAAHISDGLSQLATPLLMLPHGPGYARTLTQRADVHIPIPQAHNRFGIATVVALTSAEDRTHLDTPPHTAIRFHVTGDPCLDALHASRPARHRYRAALGVEEGQTLVTISSTWGPHSALGQNPRVIDQILAALPTDDYVVAAILHANIWNLHGEWQLRLWLRDALASGLRLIPHQRGWRQTLVATDILIGDHGSVTFYAAKLNTPVLLATDAGAIEIKHNTAIWRFLRTTPQIDTTKTIDTQIRDAITAHRDAHIHDKIRGSVTTSIDSAAQISALIYELLDLKPQTPHSDSPRICETPTLDFAPSTAHWINASVDDTDPDHPTVFIRRTPAHGVIGDHAPNGVDHLSVRTDCPSTRLLNLADVLYDHHPQIHPGTADPAPQRRPATTIAIATTTGSLVYQHGHQPITVTHRDTDRDLISSAILRLGTQSRDWEKLTVRAGIREAVAVRS
ncbi:CDP-glycerol glycerophosphotransferase family protein, partial [Mycobacteroides chelonae]|uniref:CDP-glycerol glycerophosphotransferase family protein n=9 Tax=Mycobacteroides TaxID=670516 RepID=UPI001E5A9A14